MVDITENFVIECLLKVQTFFESICGKMFSWKVVHGWMDEISKKREKILFTYLHQHKKTLVRDLHVADFCYHLDCWMDVTKI